jgi:fibrillarin-like pre-rRNA processing protein
MIAKSKIFEVFEEKSTRKIFTLNLKPSKSCYGENLINQNGIEYREWDPNSSKLASAILKGANNIFFRKGNIVLYLGSASGTTVSHVSDIVGKEGLIFAVDLSSRVMKDLIFSCGDRKNIAPILEDANLTQKIAKRICKVDIIYQDIAQRGQVEIFLKNVNMFLKKDGYCILAVKARSIDVTKQPKHIFKEVREELDKHLTVIDSKLLEPFQKDHCLFICKKNKIIPSV